MARTGMSAGGEFLAGCRDEAPLLLGVAPFGMIYGIAALSAGVPAWLAQLASAVVFAGAAQLVIVQMLAAGAGALPIALTSGLLNLRHVLYSASMAEYVRHLPRRWRLLLAYLLTDEAYAVAVLRYQRHEPAAVDAPDLRHWYFFGAGFTLWAGWQLSTAAGLLFGVLQLVSNFGFYLLAQLGKGAWGAVMVPAFDWGFVSLDAPAALDLLLLTVIAGENISGGMGTVAFVALLMGLCNQRFTATHYAMLSAFAAVGRIYVSPLSGVLSQSIGWPAFFIFSIIVAVPGVVMVWWLRDALGRLGRPQTDGAVDD